EKERPTCSHHLLEKEAPFPPPGDGLVRPRILEVEQAQTREGEVIENKLLGSQRPQPEDRQRGHEHAGPRGKDEMDPGSPRRRKKQWRETERRGHRRKSKPRANGHAHAQSRQ